MHNGETNYQALSPNSGEALCLAWGIAGWTHRGAAGARHNSGKSLKEGESFHVAGQKSLGEAAGSPGGEVGL